MPVSGWPRGPLAVLPVFEVDLMIELERTKISSSVW